MLAAGAIAVHEGDRHRAFSGCPPGFPQPATAKPLCIRDGHRLTAAMSIVTDGDRISAVYAMASSSDGWAGLRDSEKGGTRGRPGRRTQASPAQNRIAEASNGAASEDALWGRRQMFASWNGSRLGYGRSTRSNEPLKNAVPRSGYGFRAVLRSARSATPCPSLKATPRIRG